VIQLPLPALARRLAFRHGGLLGEKGLQYGGPGFGGQRGWPRSLARRETRPRQRIRQGQGMSGVSRRSRGPTGIPPRRGAAGPPDPEDRGAAGDFAGADRPPLPPEQGEEGRPPGQKEDQPDRLERDQEEEEEPLEPLEELHHEDADAAVPEQDHEGDRPETD